MARHAIPQIIDDHLIQPDKTSSTFQPIQVGSQVWYEWLDDPATRSFAIDSSTGNLTARREQRQDTWYWYAYRSLNGRTHKIYLGRSEDLTPERLREAATLFSAKSAMSHSDAPAPVQSPENIPIPPKSKMPSLHLLTTKMSVPPPRSNMVARPRLTQRLNMAMKERLTLIVAPAGWGKTTLISTWHADLGPNASPLAWVSLDAGDNDPIRFWTYVIAALNRQHPNMGENSLALLYASPSPPIEVVLTSLLNALALLPTETALVLDDYHLIETRPIHDALAFLLEHLPPNVHLVIASRSDPLLPLARLRARGVLTELRAANLRFTAEETTTFLTEVMGLPLSAEEIHALVVRTEGWIAGLHLAALSMQGRADMAGFITAFTGSHRYVVDYLVEEVLSRQPEAVQDFLMQTCLLDRLSGPLCDSVRRQSDSQALLEYVERTNLFLIPLDETRQWYRYHHLFAEVLRTRLQQLNPRTIPELHHRASTWFEQHQLFDEAVTHALAVPDIERAVRLIEQYAHFTNFPSQFQTLLGWLNRLPDAIVRMHPSLSIMHAITLMLTYQLEQASARIQDAEYCLEEEMPAEQQRTLQSLIAAFRGNLARLFGDYELCIPFAQQALTLMPETNEMPLIRMFRPSTLVTAASSYLVNGDMTPEMERSVTASVAQVRALGNIPTTMRSISNLARLQLLQGTLHQAASTIEQMMQLASAHGGLQTLLNGADYYFILGDLLREWNQQERAEQHLKQGIELVRDALTADAEMVMRGYLALARLQQARGQSTLARESLDAFIQMSRQRGFATALLAHGAAVRAQVDLAQGNLAAAIHWADTSGLSFKDEPNYLHEPGHLTLIRVRIAQGRDVPTVLPEALTLLERLYRDAEARSRMSSLLELLILQTLILQAQGNQAGALKTLERALLLAEPEGYIRLFLDEGEPIITLLRHARKQQRALTYVDTLLEAAGDPSVAASHRSPSSGPLAQPLTAREREVLRLLMDGAANREIAHQLVLSVNTVKKHVLNICGKLNVQSRAQVVAKARTLNLLSMTSG